MGDILELGDFSKEDHKRVGQSIDSSIDEVLTYGEESKYILDGLTDNFAGKSKHFINQEELIDDLKQELDENTIVLFKASRGIKLEEVVNQLV
ncbi:glutamate ligase domain-containing protein [Piscibacillus salipiscarius]|uniref:glutamate ligase domain-containing protein n=1 Tax=Piscibacillus salipiscarius TaxID=299480 RepID=UPI002436D22C|nr:hypothetical protein [Piscibacillus salipiscarius]